ncbi:hypothetical protein ACIGW3_29000 [Streptomyces sp. NPDC053499]|uniref:hypothetical protein n=2 Tax=unclassified Streptomyces TaxID=2593676 RepID=UPI00205D710B|nr:hypothetical protein HC362_08920 [Streptomyces sp. 891-h]
MTSTLTMRNIANPRRTTLAHLKDADELTTAAVAAHEGGADEGETLPERTANPRRTVLVDSPTS